MKNTTFAAVSRHAAGMISRRGSLRLLGGAALAGAVVAPELAGADNGKANRRCKKQGGQCRAYVAETCAEFEDPQECADSYALCCEPFERCNAGAGLRCFSQSVGEI